MIDLDAFQQGPTPKFPSVSEEMTSLGWQKMMLVQAGKMRGMRHAISAFPWLSQTIGLTEFLTEGFLAAASAQAVRGGSFLPARPIQVKAARDGTPKFRFLALDILYPIAAPPAVADAAEVRPTPAPKRFMPSSELVTAWRRSIDTHIASSVIADQLGPMFDDASMEEIQGAFALRFKRMIGVLGNRKRYGDLDFDRITENGRFVPGFQYEVLDRLQVVPDLSEPFFMLLKRDLYEFLNLGGIIGGKWGSIVFVDKNNIGFAINSLSDRSEAGFIVGDDGVQSSDAID